MQYILVQSIMKTILLSNHAFEIGSLSVISRNWMECISLPRLVSAVGGVWTELGLGADWIWLSSNINQS